MLNLFKTLTSDPLVSSALPESLSLERGILSYFSQCLHLFSFCIHEFLPPFPALVIQNIHKNKQEYLPQAHFMVSFKVPE
jgi:hypothetical protein